MALNFHYHQTPSSLVHWMKVPNQWEGKHPMTYSNKERQRERFATALASVLLGLLASTLGFSQHVPDPTVHANADSAVDAQPSTDKNALATTTSAGTHREHPAQEYASHPQAQPGAAERYIEANESDYEWFA